MQPMYADFESCYRAVSSRDHRFDGLFYTAVRTTGIYCRPSCPARTPARSNLSFHPTAASAYLAGYRACKRCLPDATPGSPDWDLTGDVAGRAMRLINDGVVDREGVEGLAAQLSYSSRQVNRILIDRMGAGPLALARSRRAQLARILLETSSMSVSDVAFATGFASIRQFNATMQAVYSASPSTLRGSTNRAPSGRIQVRIGVRPPFDGAALLAFLKHRAVSGVEHVEGSRYERSVWLPHGPGVVVVDLGSTEDAVTCEITLADSRDLAPAIERVRRLLDADADPAAVGSVLGADIHLGLLHRRAPGLRVPGHVDGWELAVRAILGQQVSVVAARRLAENFVEHRGELLRLEGEHCVTRLFPRPEAMREIAAHSWSMPMSRVRALEVLAREVDEGSLALDRRADRVEVMADLQALPGVGSWTASYIAMRALGDPDVFLPTDAGVRRGLAVVGIDNTDIKAVTAASAAWRPWRSYALMHLWRSDGARTMGGTHDLTS